jgi:hypothetical protein
MAPEIIDEIDPTIKYNNNGLLLPNLKQGR